MSAENFCSYRKIGNGRFVFFFMYKFYQSSQLTLYTAFDI